MPTLGRHYGGAPSTHDRLLEYCKQNGHLIANVGNFNSLNGRAKEVKKMKTRFPHVFSNGQHNKLLSKILGSKPTSDFITQPGCRVESILGSFCGSLGFEIGHLEEAEQAWFVHQIQSPSTVSPSDLQRYAKIMQESEAFDLFMAEHFKTSKRYGIEGLESMLVVIDRIAQLASSASNRKKPLLVAIGMAHRGRLNLLHGLMDYPSKAIFHQLDGFCEYDDGGGVGRRDINGHFYCGDVISHIAYRSKPKHYNGNVELVLVPNSSHLESVNPVVMGILRAIQDSKGRQSDALCLAIHGDASFCAQGVVMESLGLSSLPGFTVNGSIHLIVNNQIGFKTPSNLGRSSRYASDIAKYISAPVLHVNGHSIEAVIKASEIAIEYRQRFKKDIFIDLVGHRKHGHCEQDEPAIGHPLIWKQVRAESEGFVNRFAEAVRVDAPRVKHLAEQKLKRMRKKGAPMSRRFSLVPSTGRPKIGAHVDHKTTIEKLKQLALMSVAIPPRFAVHPVLSKSHIEPRIRMIRDGHADWSTAEAIAFAFLADQGVKVRLSGQDVSQGVFGQRHLILADQQTGTRWLPLHPNLELVDSSLSELAVLGFEYGYSLASKRPSLTIWESHFGDFGNCAQVIIDSYVVGGRAKWGLPSNLTMLMPHGFEGAGAEHSSAKIERWLQLGWSSEQSPQEGGGASGTTKQVECNFRLLCPTTPSNYFYALTEQAESMNPLVILTPNATPRARSPLADFIKDPKALGSSGYQKIIVSGNGSKLLVVYGKLYHELKEAIKQRGLQKRVLSGASRAIVSKPASNQVSARQSRDR